MKKILLLSFMLLFTVAFSAWAQDRTITGQVLDNSGEGLPGVNVILKGTTTGTTSDIDGNYRLTVPAEGGILQFSFIGLKSQEIEIGARSVIDVTMTEDVETLSEVVVTAVGIEREKKALGYSIEKIGGDKVVQNSEPDALRGLQGKIAGVNITGASGAPGSATKITIRGNSSLLGSNQPLFVVDGIPYNNNQNNTFSGLQQGTSVGSRISDLDPNNIESITVLKGGAGAALYGTRAANGVVVITTKTGGAKASRKGLEIEFRSSYAIEQIANLPEYQNKYGTGTNFNYAQANGSWGAPFPGTVPYETITEIPHWYAGRDGWGGIYDGVTVPYQAYPNNVEDLFQNGSVFENSITIQGGNDKSVLTVTATNTNNEGFVPNTAFERTSVSIGGRTQLDNQFSVGANLQYSQSQQDAVNSGVGLSGSNNSSAFARALYLGRNWDVHGQPYQNPTDLGSEFMVGRGQADNPLWSYENAGSVVTADRILASLDIQYDVTDWFNLTYKIGVNTYNQNNLNFVRPGSTGPSTQPGVGEITEDYTRYEEVESNLLGTFTYDINEDINLRGIVGWNVNQRTTDRQAFQGQGMVDFNILDVDNTNSVVPFGGTFQQRRLYGVFADVNVGFRDWAFLGITARNDWSSTLPKDNNSFFYPAVTLSTVLTEALDIQSNIVNYIKLRGSWSQVGNDTNPYQLAPTYLINQNIVNGTAALPFSPSGAGTFAGYTLSNIARDPNLKPEQTTEYEVGVETSFFNSKVGLDVTYYRRESTDQIANVTLPAETGFTSLLTNFGTVSNEGIEVTARLNPVSTSSGFDWNIIGTFTHNKNVIEELTVGVEEIAFGFGFAGGVINVHREGEEFGLLRGSVDARDDEGNLLIDPANGYLIPDLEQAIIGNPNPDFIVGITNTFSFKGVSLNAVFDWRQGGDLWSNTVLSLQGRGVLKSTEDREMNNVIPGVYGDPTTLEPYRNEAGEKVQNTTMIETNALYFGQTFAINASDEWSVFDGTTYRLREATLGYDFPKSLMDKTPFGSAQISFTGRNLWFISPNFPDGTNTDAEASQFGNTNQQGIEWSLTPSSRRYGVNLRFTF
ncbi:MAG: SusC/RagA family TonB-linked outer membrane protein [bacterium]|nr:SusC/RagA family TonB-linked outer membrane protein [bacterium]